MTAPRHGRRRPGGRAVILVIALIALVLVVAGTALVVHSLSTSRDAPRDMAGNPVQFEPGNSPAPSTIERMQVQDTDSGRLRVPSVGLDVPLGSMLAVDNVINPPSFTQAYWVRNVGVAPADASSGTVFVVSHSVSRGRAPGNYLLNVDKGSSAVNPGDLIDVDGHDYIAQSWRAVGKTQLPAAQDLWDAVPGRLVLITCLEQPDGSSPDNLVVVAQLR
ncbi:class F sortase [Propionibacterium freudenreichii]|uniref:class F sortase n=1 Tax=Propionibacterium freudenreichii TaxID=1744 RepID=UPI0025515DC8|nr:class F sortase [Propionibacterium freudenreichii]MDK9610545.1 class F sortase [Propionibacterium freudenreichii]MDK9621318.1 class F sortase [Propionibacterium freudenreichii]